MAIQGGAKLKKTKRPTDKPKKKKPMSIQEQLAARLAGRRS